MRGRRTSRALLGALFLVGTTMAVAGGGAGADDDPDRDGGRGRDRDWDPTVQHTPVTWHAQSGETGEVPDASALLIRDERGIWYRFATTGLIEGNAYTMWLVVVNDPAECAATPCAPPTDIIGNAATDSQVTFGRSATVAGPGGEHTFKAWFRAGPLLDGWLKVQGLDDPMGAEVHLVVNDHGPVIEGLEDEMTSTYRAGCTDGSLPPFFPGSAKADGTPGPNTCRLYQAAVFLPPGP